MPRALPAAQGAIEFEHVYFSYQDETKPAGLSDVARFSWRGGAQHLKRGKADGIDTAGYSQ